MNKQDIIIWDTTQFPCDYPENIKKIYFKCSISNRKSFSSWIGNVDEFSNTIKALINKKKLFLKTKKITLERATNTNIKKLIN